MKASILYKLNNILEIILFAISVTVINVLTELHTWIWVVIVSIALLLLEIFLKNEKYNPIIKRAKSLEAKSEALLNNGITNHYFMRESYSKNERNQAIANAIDKANELYLLAETGKSYLDISTDRHWKHVKRKLDNGIAFKVLLINPFSKNKEIRNSLNNVNGRLDRKFDLSTMISLSEKYPNVDIKFTDEIYCSLFFTDQYMIYDPYHLGKTADRIENNFIAIEIRNDNENYNILKSHFNNCWKNSISLNEMRILYEQNHIKL